ncbi:DUF2892 domain-containing protein [Niallia oryzisoli]|uniref:DUF2892 domain-containing protein n=1 Tax=Niallia oryzisoli TaxID=1737571 RepID=A0ABZ2CI30_9BACI
MIKVEKNIGILNALIRITIGLSLLSWCTAKLSKRPYCNSYLLMSICGAMKVAEGIVRYCPITALIQNGQGSNLFQKESDYTEARESFDETVPS